MVTQPHARVSCIYAHAQVARESEVRDAEIKRAAAPLSGAREECHFCFRPMTCPVARKYSEARRLFARLIYVRFFLSERLIGVCDCSMAYT